jgi:hypothetical protein
MQRTTMLLSLSLVATSGIAAAAGFQWRADAPSWTEPAGQPGAASVESLVSADYYAIQGLKLWDFDGRACAIQLEQGSLNAPSSRPLDAVRLCEPKKTQAWQRADVGNGQFVTGLSVCTAAGKQELHGVELWASSLDNAGKLKPAAKSVKLELARCEKWSAKRACPAGSVATGVRMSTVDSESGAVGIALRCQGVAKAEPRPSDAP